MQEFYVIRLRWSERFLYPVPWYGHTTYFCTDYRMKAMERARTVFPDT